MRLDHVAIDGFKNLHGLELDFDETKLTTVIIGQNGSGKSNLIEAIVRVFRAYDLGEDYPQFKYRIIYRIQGFKVELSNLNARATVLLDGEALSLKNFSDRKSDIFPDMIFGYYSGSGRRLESLFDRHQARYYRHVYREDTDIDVAERERRLFFCRPVHGAMALLCQSAFPDEKIKRLLNQYLRIADVHSALAVLREPSWFNQNTWNKQANIYSFKLNGRPPLDRKLAWPIDMWGAKGIAGECTRNLRDSAFMPVAAVSKESDDYRNKPAEETQLGCFLRNQSAIDQFRQKYETDQKMFQALEALDISDLVRRITVWVNRTDVTTSEVSFSDLSDGERQLLMVLGLIRIARNKRVLFLLDEPDTHLNPVWQREYLRLLETWVEEVGTDRNCQFILTSHNPLTISALSKEEVRVMWQTEAGQVKAEE
ncbi:AAA family ATPase, partial [Aquidulcibacter sp.]|uniref:AAA family ATPase n=1 Tax=Aquidulcibacter sp. TaxID=2052990 RepID=UPI0025BFB7F3